MASFYHEYVLLPSYVYNMHQDKKSARLIAVCKRTFNEFEKYSYLISVYCQKSVSIAKC